MLCVRMQIKAMYTSAEGRERADKRVSREAVLLDSLEAGRGGEGERYGQETEVAFFSEFRNEAGREDGPRLPAPCKDGRIKSKK